MAIIVENGTGVQGANSYITEAEAITFLSTRGVTAAITEPLLLNAMDEIEASCTALSLDTFHKSVTTIPDKVGQAQAWVANYILNGVDPGKYVQTSRSVKRQKVDVLETEYFEGGKPAPVTIADMPKAYGLIKQFCKAASAGDNSVGTFAVVR